MDLSSLEKQLTEWERNAQERSVSFNQLLNESLSKINVNGYTQADFEKDMAVYWQRQQANPDPAPLMEELLNQLWPDYLSSSEERRAQIREVARKSSGFLNVLAGRIHQSAKQLRATKDPEFIFQGLAAASIENGVTDYRNVLLALAELYVAAEETGIDPEPYFQEIALKSSDLANTPSNVSTRKMLVEFHRYAVLSERRARSSSSNRQ